MSKIAFYVPLLQMTQQIKAAWAISEQYELENNLYPDHKFEYCVRQFLGGEDEPIPDDEADVVVGRGASAIKLKEYYLHRDVNVVEIPVTSADLITSIRRAIKRYGNLPIGISGTFNMTYGARGMLKSTRYDVRLYNNTEVSHSNYEELVDQAERDGCRIIISGRHTIEYARSRGLCGEFMTTSVESMIHAITAAKNTAIIADKERQRSQLYHAITENTYSGILVYDESGGIITMNQSAAVLLGLKKPPGTFTSLGGMLTPGLLFNILSGAGEFKDKIVEYRGGSLVVSKTSLPYGDMRCYLATFQDAAAFVQYINDYYDSEKSFSAVYAAENSFDSLIAGSAVMQPVLTEARHLAQLDGNILITGESGTGKSAFAQAIHNSGRRSDRLFVSAECVSLTREKLLGSRLDGADVPGLAEIANNGTLLLRGVDHLPPQLQGELLGILQTRSSTRLGSRFTVPLDVRIIATTTRDLGALAQAGSFDLKLFYALSASTLELPPLRERAGDILPLMCLYLRRRLGGDPQFKFAAAEMLRAYRWPGNLHELRRACARLAGRSRSGVYTEGDVLEAVLREPPPEIDCRDLESRTEKRLIMDALARYGFSRTLAAEALGMSRTTLWRKMRKYGIIE